MRLERCLCVIPLLSLPPAIQAQEAVPAHREPRHHLVLDSVRFRVLDIRIPPGDTTQYHVHDTAVLYVVINPAATAAQTFGGDWAATRRAGPVAAGDVLVDSSYVLKPVTHRVTNNGDGVFRLLAITFAGPISASGRDRPSALPGVDEAQSTWFRQSRVRIPAGATTDWFVSEHPVLIVEPVATALGVECEGQARRDLRGPGGWLLMPPQVRCRVANDGAAPATALAIQVR